MRLTFWQRPTPVILLTTGLLLCMSVVFYFVSASKSDLGLLTSGSPSAASPNGASKAAAKTVYNADIDVDVAKKIVTGKLNVNTPNDTGKDQNAIFFHIYPNAFRDLTTKLNDRLWKDQLGKSPKPGSMDISSVIVNGEKAAFSVEDSKLEIKTPTWRSGQSLAIEMEFSIQIPQNDLRLSYDEHAIWLGNWLPIRAVHDKNGWNLDPYYAIGDPFYSDMADYQIRVTVPTTHKITTSGYEDDQIGETQGDKHTYSIKGENMREFSMMVMDDQYDALIGKSGPVTVKTWHMRTDDPDRVKFLHEVAMQSIAYFSERFGAYPHPEYDVVRTGGYFGGMEYPGLVYIQNGYFNSTNYFGGIAVAHETAHQWWFGIVGNNQVTEPWVDESLTHYATLRFMLDKFPSVGAAELQRLASNFPMAANYEFAGETIAMPIDKFLSNDSYSKLVYIKGPLMFYRLEQAIGVDTMNRILNSYAKKFADRNATGADLIQAFEDELGPGVRDYFNGWLNGKIVEYKP